MITVSVITLNSFLCITVNIMCSIIFLYRSHQEIGVQQFKALFSSFPSIKEMDLKFQKVNYFIEAVTSLTLTVLTYSYYSKLK